MRRTTIWAAAVAIIIASSAAATAEPDPKAPRAAVVAIMNDAGQALLWDGIKDEYVVVRRGDRFNGFVVSSIEADQVVLTRQGTKDHFILPRTSDTSDLAIKKKVAAGASVTSVEAPRSGSDRQRSDDLLDPYPRPRVETPSSAGIGDLSMLDPYGTTAPVTTVTAPRKKPSVSSTSAPLDPYASSAPRTPGPSAPLDPYASSAPTSPSMGAPLDPYASSAPTSPSVGAPLDPYGAHARADTSDGKSARKGKLRTEKHRISRREFDEAVTDFHALSKTVQFAIVPEGVRVDGIGRGSLFHRWGFRSGDVIMSVDDKAIRGVDDAAAVYAHLMDAKKFTVMVQRGVDTLKMNFRFKK